MRVTFVLPAYPWEPIGGFRVVYEYANHLVKRGHEVTVIHPRRLPNWTPSPRPPLRRRLLELLVTPRITWQPIDERVRMLYVSEPRARAIPDGDAVFATFWPTAELVLHYPPHKGEKFYLIQDFGSFFGPRENLEATWRAPLKKVTISRWLYDQVSSVANEKDDIAYIPNGINHQLFQLLNDIPGRPRVVVMMYSYARYKASEDGVKALETCRKEFEDFRAIAFAPYPDRPQELPPWIEYRVCPDARALVQIYNSASIFLSSSLAEGFSLPPAEAMACGCVVVATDSGGIREYAEHEKTALLSPPGDPEALAENLLRVLRDDELRVRLAQAGHERIQEFTWERSTDLLEQFLLRHVRK